MEAVYEQRGYDTDTAYSEFDAAYMRRVQSVERTYIAILNEIGASSRVRTIRVLDFGCGNGHWLARVISWGVPARNVFGVDVRQHAVDTARELLPVCGITRSEDGRVAYPDAHFDVCFANLVFTSILEDDRRVQAAAELRRLTRPGGVILIFDFRFNNPANHNVRMFTPVDVERLFPDCRRLAQRAVVLAPPIARRIASRARWLAALLESIPFLRTHFIAALAAPGEGESA